MDKRARFIKIALITSIVMLVLAAQIRCWSHRCFRMRIEKTLEDGEKMRKKVEGWNRDLKEKMNKDIEEL